MNVYQKLTNVVCELLTGVQYSLLSAATMDLNIWTSTNQILVTREVSDPVCRLEQVPGSLTLRYVPTSSNPTTAQQALADAMTTAINVPDQTYIVESDGSVDWHHDGNSAQQMGYFISNTLSAPGEIFVMSQAFGALLMTMLENSFDNNSDDNPNPSTTQQATLSSINQLVVSNGQKDQQPGGNAIKTQGSQVQTIQGNSSNEGELNTTVQGGFGNIISLLNQSYG
jgi:hypothetical protein